MKQYGITHRPTGEPLDGRFWDLRIAREIAKSMGKDFMTTAWIGFHGLPAAACVMRDDDRLETICLYHTMAQQIADEMNAKQDGHTYEVRNVMLNTGVPQNG